MNNPAMNNPRMNVGQRVAVVTGAASGIGRAISVALAQRGCHLALVDKDAAGLEETAIAVRRHKVRASCHLLDVTNKLMVSELPGQVLASHGRVDILVNNAGVALGGSFEQVSEADFDFVMEINFHSVVRMTRAFLPHLRGSDDAQLVNLSSLYGLVSPAGQAAYSASKFAVRGFSNALRHELDSTNVAVIVVHPGGVATSIAKNARVPAGVTAEQREKAQLKIEKLLRMPPQQAGEIIVRGMERRAARILVGLDAKLVAVLERLMPVRYWNLLKRGV
jgi:short-subunit dehydrogenase